VTDAELIRALAGRAKAVIDAHAAELTALDQAVGDGDHGLNMVRGFDAVAAQAEELAGLGFGAALQKAGMTLVMKVGGASGPLYGSGLMAMGKATAERPTDAAGAAAMLAAGIEAVKARGKSEAGAKTMLDVLVPVLDAYSAGAAPAELRRVASESRDATTPMLATRGRASFLGERSRGHHDPGATSAMLLVHAVCDVLERRA
jgi:phosphoenolpyruvate---glycerone phosphotransferase subunit DhaL